MNKMFFILGLSLLVASAASLDASTISLLLNLHNADRAYVGLADLTWSSSLENSAQNWADYLATNNLFQHSGEPVGENLASASNRSSVVAYMYSLWSDEKRHFSNAKPYPDVSIDGGWVGHYTQIIWGRTYTVGCGVAYQSGVNYLVCQYLADGNYIGNYVYYPSDVVRTPTGSSGTTGLDVKNSNTGGGRRLGNTRGSNRRRRR